MQDENPPYPETEATTTEAVETVTPIDDGDRLPWLEAVDDDDYDEGISPGRLIAGVLGALVAIGLIIGGVFWLKQRNAAANGDGELIAAAEGNYKVKPNDPGGMKVEGTGDVAYNVSEGGEAQGSINLDNLPEAPVKVPGQVTKADAATAAAKAPAPAAAVTAKVAPDSKLAAVQKPMPKPQPAPAAAAHPAGAHSAPATPAAAVATGAPGAGMIQLGAFSSTESAEKAWSALASRHATLKGLGKQIVPATVNGATVYRLRASAGASAVQTCAALKSAGASCNVVR